MTFNLDPNYIRPVQNIWRNRVEPQPEAQPQHKDPEPYLPWQAKHSKEFDNLLIRVFDRFPAACEAFRIEFNALEKKLCPT